MTLRLRQLVWRMRRSMEPPCVQCGRTTDMSGLVCGDPRCDEAAAQAQAMLAAEVPAALPKARKHRYTQTRASAGAWQLL